MEDNYKRHFRIFRINNNFEVWVGKNSISNDILTNKYTAQNDLWFHVRGHSGSHTVLKKLNDDIEYTKDTIGIAASICAYYSKAKNAGNVNVAYTEGKNVHKYKGAKSGSVVIEKEKIIKAKPVDALKYIEQS